MRYFEEIDGALLFREGKEILRISPWGKGLRVESTFSGELAPDPHALLPRDALPEARISITENGAEIENGEITAVLEIHPAWGGSSLQISFRNRERKTLLREISSANSLSKRARDFESLEGDAFRLKMTFIADRDEKIYGMGQYQQEIMNLKGCNLELAQRNTQVSVPFYVSSLGYGFLWNNPAIGEVHFGLNTTEWTSVCAKKLDYWVTAAPTPAQILEQYTEVVGRAPMMPEWGLGFWQCKLRYYEQQQVLDIARKYKSRDIPLDVIVVDYFHWPKCGDWRFDPEYFPDPEAMVRELHDMGIETMVSVWPQVNWESENYAEMEQQGLLVHSNVGTQAQMIFHGNNALTDVTNPRSRAYLWDKCSKNYASKGIRAFWLDEAEPGYSNYGWSNLRQYAGPVLETANLYPKEYARTFYEGQTASGQKDIVNLIRCAWAGSQRYGTLVWSGDIHSTYEDFRRQICAGLHMGMAGIPWWTTDIGGFFGGNPDDPRFRELFARWFEFGAFCPVMRLHGCREPMVDLYDMNGNQREGTGAPNEIWSYGDEVYGICKKYIRIRERLRSYTRAVMREAHETGAPVIRAMFYEFPGDPLCHDVTDAYMFGPDLLVAPVCHEGQTERQVYLPRGEIWTLLSDGTSYAGGQTVTVSAPLSVIPVFRRRERPELDFVIQEGRL